MATIKAFLNAERELKRGGFPLVIRIIHKRAKKMVYTGIYLQKDNFDIQQQRVVYIKSESLTRKKVSELNELLEEKIAVIRRIETQLMVKHPDYTAAELQKKFQLNQNNKYLFTYLQQQILFKQKIARLGTAKAYQATFNSLEHYLGQQEVMFSDIDSRFIRNYEIYLKGTGVTQNTVNYYLRNLRSVYNKAYDDGIEMGKYDQPFRNIHIQQGRTLKRALKKEIIERIAKLDLSGNEQMKYSRDLFLFSFFTRGMSFIDIVTLKHSDIVDRMICYRRTKTNQQMQVYLTNSLEEIIERYKGDNEYLFPFLNRTEKETMHAKYKAAYGIVHRNLRKIAARVGINTPLTMHVARHSWATAAKEEGVSISAISESLGHASEKTTRIYLKDFDAGLLNNINEIVTKF